jgi:ABC-type multidrug transport system fused ATPase/permease subunit
MARALLEHSKILIMDEATSNIDGNTDNVIQTMLKEIFADCTVLTIAHRIDTILWYDKVLVLGQGEIVEYDSPEVLSKKEGSEFKALLLEYRKGREANDDGVVEE